MPLQTADPLHRFLRAVRRRLLAVRLVESSGIGVLAGCVVAAMLVTIQLWRNSPTMPIAIVMMTVGGFCGVLWTIRRWPTLIDAAREADRQLDLSDLLATASAVQCQVDDPWTRTVLALANDRCQTLSPSALVLNRLGARQWGGIGVAVALVMAVSLLGTQPRPLAAREARDPALTSPEASEFVQEKQAPSSLSARPQSDPESSGSQGAETAPAPDPFGSAGASSSSRSAEADRGSQAGSTDRSQAPESPGWAAGQNHSAIGPAGSGGISTGGPSGDEFANGLESGSPEPGQTPPWHSPSWQEDRARADTEIDAGTVPDAYRDVVREYFAR